MTHAADPEGTRRAIRARMDAAIDAWNRGDLEGYLEGYRDSEETRMASGSQVIRGKDAIARGFRARYTTSAAMGTFEHSGMEVELLGEADALVFARWRHTVDHTVHQGVFTVHLRKIGDDWYVVSDHTSAG
jgi:uncharacterized protein (TIGR02246 family)